MDSLPRYGRGKELAAGVRAEAKRLGLEALTTRYIAERRVVRLSWPHPTKPTVEQSVDFPVSAEWAERIGQFLRLCSQAKKRAGHADGVPLPVAGPQAPDSVTSARTKGLHSR